MSGFQVSAADTFLGRSRSGGNYFGSMTDTRGPLYPVRCRCGIFISSQDVRGRRERAGRTGSFYERIYPFSSEFDLYDRRRIPPFRRVYLSFYSKQTSREFSPLMPTLLSTDASVARYDISRVYLFKYPLKFEYRVGGVKQNLSPEYREQGAVAIGPESHVFSPIFPFAIPLAKLYQSR